MTTAHRAHPDTKTYWLIALFLAVVTAGLTTGTIVWTANAWLTVGVSALWGRLQ